MLISSRANERVKAIRALGKRKERDARGVFFVEGAAVVKAALDIGAEIESMVFAMQRLTPEEDVLRIMLERRDVPFLDVTPEVYDSLSFREDTDSLGIVVRQRWENLTPETVGHRCWVALHEVQHPGNLGTIIRTVDAIGGDGVVLFGRGTDPFHPIAVRGSLGAIFSQRILRADRASLAQWLRQGTHSVVGTSPQGDVDYREADYAGKPVVLIAGNERTGLSAEQAALCDKVVRIPMHGLVDSLNLSVATALVLYEVFRQQETRAG